jgi:hypothetical protein
MTRQLDEQDDMDLIIFIDSERLDANTGRDLTVPNPSLVSVTHIPIWYATGHVESWNHSFSHLRLCQPSSSNTTLAYALDITPQQRILLSV